MRIIQSISEMRDLAAECQEAQKSIGYIPTRGCLHRGHASLLKAARQENDLVLLGIFVDPGQLEVGESVEDYPRDLQADAGKAEAVAADLIFAPSLESLFPPGFSTWVEPERTDHLCQQLRPGYFRSACTALLKQLHIVQPQRLYFGQKDAQLFVVASRMARDLELPVELKMLPTIRDQEGLAISTRNSKLTPEARRQAALIHAALQAAERVYSEGEHQVAPVRAAMEGELRKALLGSVTELQFLDLKQLLPVERITGRTLVSLAMSFGSTQLHDNTILG